MQYARRFASLIFIPGLMGSVLYSCVSYAQTTDQDPAEVVIGERLFLETRFAQAYYANRTKPDPALDYTVTMDMPLQGPFAGKTMNCRACHMVDEHQKETSAGMRTYADFSHNSPVPDRKDGNRMTARNSMSLVNISPTTEHEHLFHYDGEFNSMEDLVRGTLTGRNYGWLADESAQAIQHIANIIRSDDGQGELAKEFGGSYQKILTAADKTIPAEFQLPAQFRVDVKNANDKQIFDAIARLIAAYVDNLEFAKDEQGNYIGSPYDQFLKLNNLPRQPGQGESEQDYAQRLLKAVNRLKSPKFITGKNNRFNYHRQAFVFGETEFRGM
ncbi:MAG: cytochrome c peroxidase, partial [Thioalkalispiraceae bacterium]